MNELESVDIFWMSRHPKRISSSEVTASQSWQNIEKIQKSLIICTKILGYVPKTVRFWWKIMKKSRKSLKNDFFKMSFCSRAQDIRLPMSFSGVSARARQHRYQEFRNRPSSWKDTAVWSGWDFGKFREILAWPAVPTPWHRLAQGGRNQNPPKIKIEEFCGQMFVVIDCFPDRYIWLA